MKEEPKCVQCGEPMGTTYGNESFAAPFCSEPLCPNYGLLQSAIIPEKEIPQESGD